MNRQEAKRALSQWMKSARQKLAIRQDDLGAQLGCSGVHISQMERGRRQPSDEILLKTARLLGCDKREVRGLFLLRARASSDVTPEDFKKLYGDEDELAIAGLETNRFIVLMQNAEQTIPHEEFFLLQDIVTQVIDLSGMIYNRSLRV